MCENRVEKRAEQIEHSSTRCSCDDRSRRRRTLRAVAAVTADEARAELDAGIDARAAGDRAAPGRTPRPLATSDVSRRSSCTAASRTGSPTSGRARDERRHVLFVAGSARPRRADRRAAAGLRRPRRAGRARRRRARTRAVLVADRALSRGFRLPDAALQVYAETDVFEEERRTPRARGARRRKAFLSDLRDLKVGDLVVHVDHGIGSSSA